MIFDIYNPYENQTVTTEYVSVIEKCLNLNGIETQNIDVLEKRKENKDRGIIVILPSAAIRAKNAGYKKIVLWVQGASAEESRLRNNSNFRYFLLNFIERKGLKCADLILFVSETMKEYFENKFKMVYDNCYIMPCFNNEIDKEYFYTENKYQDNMFIYAGSLAPWQCFEPTVGFYKKIEECIPNASFRVLVKDHKTAAEILKKYGVKNYSLGFVPQSEIGKEMAKAKFGFCLREDSIINRVATPTKLSTYIAHGVMPVYSSSIEDFARRAGECLYCICVDYAEEKSEEEIVRLCKDKISPDGVLKEFTEKFGNYFSKEYHQKLLSEKIKDILT